MESFHTSDKLFVSYSGAKWSGSDRTCLCAGRSGWRCFAVVFFCYPSLVYIHFELHWLILILFACLSVPGKRNV